MSSNPSVKLGRLTNARFRYEYPKGVGGPGLQHFMIINEYKFNEPQNRSGDPFAEQFNGQTFAENIIGADNQLNLYEIRRSFVLHLPPGSLKTQYTADYADVNLGIFGEIFSQNVSKITDDVASYYEDFKNNKLNTFGATADFYKNVGTSVADAAEPYISNSTIRNDFANRIKFNLTSAIGGLSRLGGSNIKGEQLASLSMRSARNPYTSLIFAGIKKLREFTFNFDFNPKNATESDNIMKILSNLKHGMLPSLPNSKIKPNDASFAVSELTPEELALNRYDGGSNPMSKQYPTYKITNKIDSAFFTYPNVYTIRFYSNESENRNLYQIGNSFLTSLKIKYTPDFFEENGMPTAINAQMSFKENFGLDRSHAEKH